MNERTRPGRVFDLSVCVSDGFPPCFLYIDTSVIDRIHNDYLRSDHVCVFNFFHTTSNYPRVVILHTPTHVFSKYTITRYSDLCQRQV
jgi:hypothetical protein